jgi:mannose-6-phosphate isomerase-like protein (cupin superfamily)
MLKETRRVLSGLDKNQKSILLADEKIASFIPYSIFPSFQLQELFYTEDKPQSLNTCHMQKPYDLQLPEGAIRFLKIHMPIKAEMSADLEKEEQPLPSDWTKFNLHQTDSIDYIYILSGSVTCIVGIQSTELHAGDFLVQIGPEHTWINSHNEPCHCLCVMVGTQPTNQKNSF